jgi:hypothetical protein
MGGLGSMSQSMEGDGDRIRERILYDTVACEEENKTGQQNPHERKYADYRGK